MDLNRDILECKYTCISQENDEPSDLNRDILECKFAKKCTPLYYL